MKFEFNAVFQPKDEADANNTHPFLEKSAFEHFKEGETYLISTEDFYFFNIHARQRFVTIHENQLFQYFTPENPIDNRVIGNNFAVFAEKFNGSFSDSIYRRLWLSHVTEDIKAEFCSRYPDAGKENNVSQEKANAVIEACANRYVYEGKYDCNLSYWENINSLIREEMTKPDDNK